MQVSASVAIGAGGLHLNLTEAATHMAPAKGEDNVAVLGEAGIGAIAFDLQGALEARQVRDRPFMLAIGRIDIGHSGRLGTAPRPIIARISPELTGLGAAASGIEHRCRCLVGEQFGRTFQSFKQASVDGAERGSSATHPIG